MSWHEEATRGGLCGIELWNVRIIIIITIVEGIQNSKSIIFVGVNRT